MTGETKLASILSMVSVLGGAVPLHAQTAAEPPARETRCAIDGWTNNRFGEDIPIREHPNASAPVVGRLPVTPESAQNAYGDRLYSVRMDIVGFSGGWLRIDHASDRYNDTPPGGARRISSPSGWMPADGVRFQIQSAFGYDTPSLAGRKILDLANDWATDIGAIERVLACNGSWVLVDLRLTHRRIGDRLIEFGNEQQTIRRAWFRDVCGNEETTCQTPRQGGGD